MGERRDGLKEEALEEALGRLLYDPKARERFRAGEAEDQRLLELDIDDIEEAARAVRRMVRERVHRGTGGLEAWFPQTVAAWREAHPEDADLGALIALFCGSPSCAAWREHGSGVSLEEAWFRFWIAQGVGDSETVEEEFLGAIVRALAVTPRARFDRPTGLRDAPRGCFAVSRGGVLHAVLDGCYVQGPLTPLIVEMLEGSRPEDVARRHGVDGASLAAVVDALRAKGLLG
jgi:hypothetical protein